MKVSSVPQRCRSVSFGTARSRSAAVLVVLPVLGSCYCWCGAALLHRTTASFVVPFHRNYLSRSTAVLLLVPNHSGSDPPHNHIPPPTTAVPPPPRGGVAKKGEGGEETGGGGGMRAWTCHGRTQRDLVDRLRQAGIVHSDAVADVLAATDRRHYVPPPDNCSGGGSNGNSNSNKNRAEEDDQPYRDAPAAIGLGQTISAPHMHARVLEEILPYVALNNNSGSNNANVPVKILDVGCGSGYLTACLGRWLQPHGGGGGGNNSILGRAGRVYGIDIHPALVALSTANLQQGDADLLRGGRDDGGNGAAPPVVVLQHGNGWMGLWEEAPFDAIHVGAAAAALPRALALQLRVGGVLIVPIGPDQGAQALYKVERLRRGGGDTGTTTTTTTTPCSVHAFDESDYRVTALLGVRYVPLIQQPPGS